MSTLAPCNFHLAISGLVRVSQSQRRNLIYWGGSSPLRLSHRVQLFRFGGLRVRICPPCIAGTWRCGKCSTKCTQLRRIFTQWPTREFMLLSEDTCTSSNSVDTNQKPTAIRSLASVTSLVSAV